MQKPRSLEDSDLSRLYTATSLMQIDDNVMRCVLAREATRHGVPLPPSMFLALPPSAYMSSAQKQRTVPQTMRLPVSVGKWKAGLPPGPASLRGRAELELGLGVHGAPRTMCGGDLSTRHPPDGGEPNSLSRSGSLGPSQAERGPHPGAGRDPQLRGRGSLEDPSQNGKARGPRLCPKGMRFSESLWPGVGSACWLRSSRPLGARAGAVTGLSTVVSL